MYTYIFIVLLWVHILLSKLQQTTKLETCATCAFYIHPCAVLIFEYASSAVSTYHQQEYLKNNTQPKPKTSPFNRLKCYYVKVVTRGNYQHFAFIIEVNMPEILESLKVSVSVCRFLCLYTYHSLVRSNGNNLPTLKQFGCRSHTTYSTSIRMR